MRFLPTLFPGKQPGHDDDVTKVPEASEAADVSQAPHRGPNTGRDTPLLPRSARTIFPNPRPRLRKPVRQAARHAFTVPEVQWWREQYLFTAPSVYVERAGMALLGAAWMGVVGAPWSLAVGGSLLALSAFRLRDAARAWAERAPLLGMPMTAMSFEDLWARIAPTDRPLVPLLDCRGRDNASASAANPQSWRAVKAHREALHEAGRAVETLYLGEGFPWDAEKTRALYPLLDLPHDALRVPDWVRFAYGYPPGLAHQGIGTPLLHGVGLAEERTITHPVSSLGGGTLIVGTTQSGKGVVLTNLVAQAIMRHEAVIVIDPKSSKRLRAAIRTACEKAGRRPPLEFHPAFPKEGVRLDPLGSWSRPSEIATRITAMLPADQTIFNDFAWNAVNVIVQGLFFLTEKPNLVTLRHLVEEGLEGVLERAIEKDLNERGPANWQADFDAMDYPTENRLGYPIPKVQKLAEYWEGYYRDELRGPGPEAIHPMLAVYRHNREHYAKITASLQPLLSMLTTGSLARSLSPDPLDENDERPIVTLERVIDAGEVLYLGLDALPDAVVAGALGNLILSDLTAYTGKRYNRGTSGRRVARVSLFVDETANVINRPMIELFNKGMEAGVHVTAAMQTIADLSAALGHMYRAQQALGNFNNLIALRTKDRDTQHFVLETFGEATVWNEGISLGSAAVSEIVPTFRASVTRSSDAKREALIPQEMLGKLPDGEFFASIAGGKIYKGRMPIVRDPDAPREEEDASLDED